MAIPIPIVLAGAAVTALILSAGSKKASASPAAPASGLPPDLDAQLQAVLQSLGVRADGSIGGPVTAAALQAATMLSGQMETLGFRTQAQQLRDIVARAAKMLPPLPPDQQLPASSTLPKDLQDKLNHALQFERDPARLRAIAAALRALPNANEPQIQLAINMLENLAQQSEAAQRQQDALKDVDKVVRAKPGQPLPVRSPGQPTAPRAPAPAAPPAFGTMPITSPGLPTAPPGFGTQPVVPEPPASRIPIPATPKPQPLPARKTPAQTAAEGMTMQLLALEQKHGVTGAKGKEDVALVKRFQKSEGLKEDGKIGPGTLLAAAQHVGNLPHVWHWPTSTTAAGVEAYRVKLLAMAVRADAAGDTLRAQQLKQSAARENGEGGIVGTPPVKLTPAPAPSPSVPSPVIVPPPANSPPATTVPLDDNGLSALAMTRNLLDAQIAGGGSITKARKTQNVALVKDFQMRMGAANPDGKAGPGTMLKAGAYVGELPLVMYWPQKANKKTVDAYNTELVRMAKEATAAGDSTRGAELLKSASREQGQGGIAERAAT